MARLIHKDDIGKPQEKLSLPKKAKNKRKNNKARKAQLVELGCIVCLLELNVYSIPEIHHIRAGQGLSQRAPDSKAIGLCHPHHRTGGYGVAIHAGQEEFERRHGTETALLSITNKLLEKVAS